MTTILLIKESEVMPKYGKINCFIYSTKPEFDSLLFKVQGTIKLIYRVKLSHFLSKIYHVFMVDPSAIRKRTQRQQFWGGNSVFWGELTDKFGAWSENRYSVISPQTTIMEGKT